MTKHTVLQLVLITALTALSGTMAISAEATQRVTLVSFEPGFDLDSAKTQDASGTLQREGNEYVLRLDTGHRADWPGVTFEAPNTSWDLSDFTEVAMDITNCDDAPVTINCRVDGPGGDGATNSLTERVTLGPRARGVLRVQLSRKLPPQLATKLFGMRGNPGGVKEDGLDVSRITRLVIFINKPRQDHAFELTDIRAQGPYQQGDWHGMSPAEFFPMIDPFGQFVHKQWAGKTQSVEQLRQDACEELKEFDSQPGPGDWTLYGGWQAGPQWEATGYFFPVKYGDQWWLVDPTGKLFWSHGVDCAGFANGTTPVSDREFYFTDLPPHDSPLAKFYGQSNWAPHGYYQGRGSYRTFNFTGANLMRKYGEGWYEQAADRLHRRLRSWSMNTIANWSDAGIYRQRRTPYVVAIDSIAAKRIEGSEGYWGKFPDPFDPSFRQTLDRRMHAEREHSAGDSWCLGYFVDNELAWGDEWSLAISALASPATQQAKIVFMSDLQAKYRTIEKLNDAWGTSHESWPALATSRTPPERIRAEADLGAFYSKLAEEYFRQCRDAIKQVAPKNLYLGCRFAWVNPRGARAAAKYCDVMSYNLYQTDVSKFELPDGLDRPVIIGEFHFGALDRGMFHPGLRPTASQQDRAEAYRQYVTGALKNPWLVGTHWFQYGDQATTGRGDGENYQIGLVDICDRPYPETVAALRDVGRGMYETRSEAHHSTQATLTDSCPLPASRDDQQQ